MNPGRNQVANVCDLDKPIQRKDLGRKIPPKSQVATLYTYFAPPKRLVAGICACVCDFATWGVKPHLSLYAPKTYPSRKPLRLGCDLDCGMAVPA